MTNMVTIRGSDLLSTARSGVTDVQKSIQTSMREQTTGLRVFADTSPAAAATVGTMQVNVSETAQAEKNMLRGSQILRIVLPALENQKAALMDALSNAQAVGSDLLTPTEVNIENTAYQKSIEQANNVALTANFLGDYLLSQGAAVGSAQADTAAAVTGLTAQTNLGTVSAQNGGVEGAIEASTVTDNGDATFGFSVTIGGVIYSNAAVTLANTTAFDLTSEFDGFSTVTITTGADVSSLTTSALIKAELDPLLAGAAFTADYGTVNSTNFAFDVSGLSATGNWILTQNGDNLFLLDPNGGTYTASLTTGTESGTIFLGGLKVDLINYDTGDLIASTQGNQSVVLNVTTAGGYSKTVAAGNASIDITFGDQKMATYGLANTTILTTAAAQAKETTIKSIIASYDGLIGRLGATLISFESTQESLGKQNEELERVIGSVQDANTVKVVQSTVQDMLRQQFAAQGFSSSVQHIKTLTNALAQSQ